MMTTIPFLGKGFMWPLQINPATGGIAMSVGTLNLGPIGLSFLPDRAVVAPDAKYAANKIAEAMTHILSVDVGEYDFLPRFGSRPTTIINEPNLIHTQMEYETWASIAVERWEKRAFMQVPQDFRWFTTFDDMDKNVSRLDMSPHIISNQVQGNLVAPFATARDVRNQEFPLGSVDIEGHDWCSRYYNSPATLINGERCLRARKVLPIPFKVDDQYYTVVYGDTWYTISDKLYQDVRFDWVLVDFYTNDMANSGASRRALKTTEELEPGTLLRAPSRARLLSEIAV